MRPDAAELERRRLLDELTFIDRDFAADTEAGIGVVILFCDPPVAYLRRDLPDVDRTALIAHAREAIREALWGEPAPAWRRESNGVYSLACRTIEAIR